MAHDTTRLAGGWGAASQPDGNYRLNALVIVAALAAWPNLARPSSCSVVASREKWLNSVPDLVPALVLGLMTSIGMWQLTSLVLVEQRSPLTSWPSSPSSQVRKIAVEPFLYWGLFRMAGRWEARPRRVCVL